MRLKGNTYEDIGRMMGVTKQTVLYHIKPLLPVLESAELLPAYQENRADILDGIQARLAGNLLDKDKVQKATLGNVAYAMKQLNDISRLERDQSTSNVAVQHIDKMLTVEEVDAEIMTVTEQLPQLKHDKPNSYDRDPGLQSIEEQIQAVIQASDIIEDTG